jgi:hypothetical protein
VNQNECTRVTLSAPAAAIGALDVDEAAFLRSHLRSCDRPHPEVGEWLVVAGAVGSALPHRHHPSPGLRDRLLLAARRDPPT